MFFDSVFYRMRTSALAALAPWYPQGGAGRIVPLTRTGSLVRKYQRKYKLDEGYTPHQGERECARRRRQIEKGQLRLANGLCEVACTGLGRPDHRHRFDPLAHV